MYSNYAYEKSTTFQSAEVLFKIVNRVKYHLKIAKDTALGITNSALLFLERALK